MKRTELMRTVFLMSGLCALTSGLVFAAFLGAHHLESQAMFAAAAKVVSAKGDCKLGDLNFSGASSMGEQECKRGAEYEIIAPTPGKLVYDIKTTKCPPPPPPTPNGTSASQWKKQWDERQPDGIVRFKTPTNGTVIVSCKTNFKSSSALMSEVQAVSSQNSINPTSILQPPSSVGLPSSPLSQDNSISDAFTSSANNSNPLPTTDAPGAAPQKSLDDIAKEIDQKRADLNSNDPALQQAAQNYFASQSRLGESRYIGVEADNPYTDNSLGASISKDVRTAVAANTSFAVSDTFANAGSQYQTSVEQNGFATRVVDTSTGNELYYSNLTGRPFMEANGTSLALVSADGASYPVAPGGDWQNQLGTLDKTEYSAFADRYLSPTGMPVQSFKYEAPNEGMKDYPSGRVTVTDIAGNKNIISADEYQSVLDAGKRVYDTDQLAREINQWTLGKITLTPPDAFPSSNNFFFRSDGNLPADSMTPLSIGQYSDNMQKMYDVYKQLPPELWASNGALAPTTVSNFAFDPEQTNRSSLLGLATLGGGNQWANPNNSYDFYMSTSHELGHNLSNVFPTTDQWGTNVYGPSWVNAYGGEVASDAMAGKFGDGRPTGYATIYGYAGGVREDQAEVFGAMLTNYPAVQASSANDPVLAQKVQMIQDSFYTATNGAMDQNYWNTLKVLDQNYVLSPANPNFMQKVSQAISAMRSK